ncbi:unnamed protein product [Cyclocybe aegerita]|uniref:G domain-containing protein n=1 Tax=Cyclocybe aegerita TaxID=1973307 RepID=A0A8S0W4N5_CYCAE|nr:unnamed protein product [Cyclocybe aegerita]
MDTFSNSTTKGANPRCGETNDEGTTKTEIVIPVIGPTGSGKSTFINVASRDANLKEGHGMHPCTTGISRVVIDTIPDCPKLKNFRLVLLDTPGFDNTLENDLGTAKLISDWKTCLGPNVILGGVLYLHDITTKRVTNAALRNLGFFSRIFGHDAIGKTILVTTNWGASVLEAFERREMEMKSDHWKDLLENGAVVHRFHPVSLSSAWDIIGTLLQRFDPPCSHDFPVIDIVIPILGLTGSGKSTLGTSRMQFVNVALGRDQVNVGHKAIVCTTQPDRVVVDSKPGLPSMSLKKGYRLVLVDTPGLDDTVGCSNVEIMQQVKQLVPGALYLYDISVKRYAHGARQSLELFLSLCCSAGISKAILVTTNWGSATIEELEQREEFMKTEHWKSILDQKIETRRFMGDSESAWGIINALLQ